MIKLLYHIHLANMKYVLVSGGVISGIGKGVIGMNSKFEISYFMKKDLI
jgi:hypothetical protein